ncbi:glycosyltransferase [Erwinia sp. S59]|uniref:glycosyltransferase n=1 Tax=Erwinia sp. S59 TaxID=2769340 RepID=UPI00190E21C9|nr:glycosyltransferase [Erwinia sp. S59]MBK0092099.1 glycosyltransferase [Erwinia sp. S59]
MRICYYNWVDYDDKRKRGGGVTVYQKNIIESLNGKKENEIFFISSGVTYNPFSNKITYKKADKKYDIINSGTLAPSHLSFSSYAQITHRETEDVFMDILKDIGEIDIIHFNNLEGIPVKVLEKIKSNYPSIRVIFSVHNYYPFCPQVNLWERERKNCKDYNGGRKCVTCVSHSHGEGYFKKNYFLDGILLSKNIKDNSLVSQFAWSAAHKANNVFYKIRKLIKPIELSKPLVNFSENSSYFIGRRQEFINAINEYCDVVLTVSKRVADICNEFGIKRDLLRVSYIGTAHYSKYLQSKPKGNKISTIAYLGYMRKDKGFEFFIDSLRKVPVNIAKNINLVVAAKRHNEHYYYLLKELTSRFNNVYFADGYTHKNIDEILEHVDLGIVPVLWEDNLPQVAIEMHCRRIPILTSDLGGACELHRKHPRFTFQAGNYKDFITKLTDLTVNGYDSLQYWSESMSPVSMEQHVNELIEFYDNPNKIIHLEMA